MYHDLLLFLECRKGHPESLYLLWTEMRDTYASENRCHVVSKQPSAKKKQQELRVKVLRRTKTSYSLQEKRRRVALSNSSCTNSRTNDWPVHTKHDITDLKHKLIQTVT